MKSLSLVHGWNVVTYTVQEGKLDKLVVPIGPKLWNSRNDF